MSRICLIFLCIGFVSADWNILNYKWRSSSDSNNLKSYCESWRINVELNNIRDFDVVPQECVDYISHYMKSIQYVADSERAIDEAQEYLSGCCSLHGDGKDAWIFDVDDTLLSTIPYYKKHGFGGEKANGSSLEEWMRDVKAPALEHTLKFYKEIKNKGIKIFLISSRKENLRSATVDNLIKVGYQSWTSLVLRDVEDETMKVSKFKREVRKKLVKEGYCIWGIIGDQWSSFNGLPNAKRSFKLPNSIYYIP